MAVVFALVVFDKFLVVVEKIAFEPVSGNKRSACRLMVDDHLGFFCIEKGKDLLVLVFFDLIFRLGIGEFVRRFAFARTFSPLSVKFS